MRRYTVILTPEAAVGVTPSPFQPFPGATRTGASLPHWPEEAVFSAGSLIPRRLGGIFAPSAEEIALHNEIVAELTNQLNEARRETPFDFEIDSRRYQAVSSCAHDGIVAVMRDLRPTALGRGTSWMGE